MGELKKANGGGGGNGSTLISVGSDARKEERVGKSNTENGLGDAQRDALLRLEAKIGGRKSEVAYAVREDGEVVKISTSSSRDGATIDDGLIPRDSVITHNHPSIVGRGGTGMAARIGASFSGDDLYTAAMGHAKEMRIQTPTYKYSIKRNGDNWGTTANHLRRTWNDIYSREMNKLTLRYLDRSLRGVGDYNVDIGRMNVMATHVATREVARMFGLKYTRRKA